MKMPEKRGNQQEFLKKFLLAQAAELALFLIRRKMPE